MGDQLKVQVSAPPERGKANKAVCICIAKFVEVPARDVTVVQGQTSPRKRVAITGDNAAIRAKLDSI